MEKPKDLGTQPTWQAQSLRFTGFALKPPAIADQTWWRELTGRPPRKRTSEPEAGRQQDEGPFEDGELVLALEPSRIDLKLCPVLEPTARLEVLGPYPRACVPFVSTVQAFLRRPDTPPLHRIALGCVLHYPVATLQEGYQVIMQMAPGLRLDGENVSDVFFQINRSRISTSYPGDGLRINRLTKWGVAQIHLVSIVAGGPSVRQLLPGELAVRLELDINTDGNFQKELDRDKLPPLFEEFVQLADEIAMKGDQP